MSGPASSHKNSEYVTQGELNERHLITLVTSMMMYLLASQPALLSANGMFSPSKRATPNAKLSAIKRLAIEAHDYVKALSVAKRLKIQVQQTVPAFSEAFTTKIGVLEQLLFSMIRDPHYSKIPPQVLNANNVPAFSVLAHQIATGNLIPHEFMFGNLGDYQRNYMIKKIAEVEANPVFGAGMERVPLPDKIVSKDLSRDDFAKEILKLTGSLKDATPVQMALILSNMKLEHYLKRCAFNPDNQEPTLADRAAVLYKFLQISKEEVGPNQQAFEALYQRVHNQLLPGMSDYIAVEKSELTQRRKVWLTLLAEIQESTRPNAAAEFIFDIAGQLLQQKMLEAIATSFSLAQRVKMPNGEQLDLKDAPLRIASLSKNELKRARSSITIDTGGSHVKILWQTYCSPASLQFGIAPDEVDLLLDPEKNRFIFHAQARTLDDIDQMQTREMNKRAFCAISSSITLTYPVLDLTPGGMLGVPKVEIQSEITNYVPHLLKMGPLLPGLAEAAASTESPESAESGERASVAAVPKHK